MMIFGAVGHRMRQLRTAALARWRLALGYPALLHTPDRRLLEQKILPALAGDPDVRKLVFVGCDWYTSHYERLLPGVQTHTVDPDPRRGRYGAARHHVAALQQLADLFSPGSVDAIVCNGVYGWGLNHRDDCEQAIRACVHCLRPGGWFVLGWNDVPHHDPAPLAALTFKELTPHPLRPFDSAQTEVSGSTDRHTYAFFRRSASAVPDGLSGS
jgi:SAM-dependent methyltransferase